MNNSPIFQEIEFPVLILSSKAGYGNYSVGSVLNQQLSSLGTIYHLPIEELISADLRKIDFERYKLICEKCPWLLRFIYLIPINFYLKYLQELIFKNTKLTRLKEKINSLDIKTIVCTNHRSAFWTSSLKRKGEIKSKIYAFITDHYLGSGWKFIFWSEVDRLLGPLNKNDIPKNIVGKFMKADLPVQKEYLELAKIKGNKNEVLITGGGWGLGPIFEVTKLLHKRCKSLKLHVVCGANIKLFNKLKKEFKDNPKILIYTEIQSLIPIMEKCSSVITKPGAVTVMEAYKAGRKIYLLPGLPVIEEYNRLYEIKSFLAIDFSLKHFQNSLSNEKEKTSS